MAAQLIQITSNENQTQTVTVNIDDSSITLILTFTYSAMAGYWILKIADQDNNVVLDSIPMVPGYYPAGNLLGSYVYKYIGSCYLVNVSNSGEDYPTQDTLATDWELIWSDTGRVS